MIRKFGSAILGVSWHPSGEFLAAASADEKCRVCYAHPPGEGTLSLLDPSANVPFLFFPDFENIKVGQCKSL